MVFPQGLGSLGAFTLDPVSEAQNALGFAPFYISPGPGKAYQLTSDCGVEQAKRISSSRCSHQKFGDGATLLSTGLSVAADGAAFWQLVPCSCGEYDIGPSERRHCCVERAGWHKVKSAAREG
jgi:hypothetical protein